MSTKRFILSTLELAIVTTFILIAIYIITGGFTYSHIRIFGTYPEAHNLWRPLLTLLALIGIVELLKHIWGFKTRPWAFERPIYHLITMLILYNALLIPFVLFRYYSFNLSLPEDLALYNQAIFNTVHGRPLLTTCFGYIQSNWNYLADHFSLSLLLFVPIYYFFQDASTLLVIQIIVISLGALPIYLIAKDSLKSNWAGLLISAVYLLYPLITKFHFYELRQDYFAMVFLLFAFWCLETHRRWQLLVFIFLALICKENVFISVVFFCFYILFKKKFKKHVYFGILIALFSILFGILTFKYFMPYFREYAGGGIYAHQFHGLKDCLQKIPSKYALDCGKKVLSHFIDLIRTMGYTPMLSPIILLGMESYIENFIGCLSHWESYVIHHHWHSALFIPFLFIAYIFGINNLLTLGKRFLKHIRFYRHYILAWTIGLPLLIGALDFNKEIIRPFVKNNLANAYKPDFYNTFYKAYKHIPQKGSLLSPFSVCANLSSRKELFIEVACRDIKKTDYAFLSTLPRTHSAGENNLFSKLLTSGTYEELYSNKNFTLYVHKDNIIKQRGPKFEFSNKKNISGWEINHSHIKYKYANGLGGLYIDTYFDGNTNEDESVQVRKKILKGININQYPYFEIVFKIEDPAVQFIEVVLGIDVDKDGKIDHYISGLYKENIIPNRFTRYRLNTYELLKEIYPHEENFTIYHIEFNPHKKWCLDCTGKKKGWYKFWIKDIKFFNLTLKNE